MSRQCIVLTLRHRDYGITVTGRFEVYTQGPRRVVGGLAVTTLGSGKLYIYLA